jgi:shikimate kinase
MIPKKKKVILTGYRATGKTTVGKLVARQLGVDFYDMDKVLEERQGCTVAEIVAAGGWQRFRDLENMLLAEMAGLGNGVIATGGGAIQHRKNWQRLMETGLVVWLTADRDTICARLTADAATDAQRPALTDSNTLDEVTKVLAVREPLYRQGSHLEIDTTAKSAEEISAEIIQFLETGAEQ